jgi:protocatechuate 3,4-dioxygenase beta subunit
LLAALFSILLPTAHANQSTTPTAVATVTIHGSVLADPGGQPIRKANIHLNPRGRPSPADYDTTTDAEGQFTIDNVQTGRYGVRIERPGFVQSAIGRSAYIYVQTDTAKAAFIFRMQPAAVIVGKILDADGDPIGDVAVTAQRVDSRPGSLPLQSQGSGLANDLGEFRISGLRPGRYTITAAPPQGSRPLPPGRPATDKDQTVYATTYYPGTLNEDQAVPVELHPGDETRINFGVLTSRVFRVSGTLTGVPVTAVAQLMLESRGHGGSPSVEQELAKDGKFEFEYVPPGSYTPMLLLATFGGAQPVSMQMLNVGQPIEVTNGNVQDVRLQVEPGGQIRGKFRLETGQKFDWTQLTVGLAPVDEKDFRVALPQGPMGTSTIPGVNPDGTFEMKNAPGGIFHLVVGAKSDDLRDYFTKSIHVDGRDVSDSGFQVRADTYLDIVVGANGAGISGIVVDDQGQPVPDATVVSIPSADHSKRPDLYQQDTTDARGHFALRGLNPGKYTVLAFEDLQEDFRRPEFRKSYETRGETLQLDESAHKNIALTLIPAAE